MTEQEYDILEHDWETLKAKYIIGKTYSELEQDVLAFCELGYYYALYFYAPIYREGENRKIDAIINSFPDMSMQDIMFAMQFTSGKEKALANRAYIKKTRKHKGKYKGLNKEKGFELAIRANAMAEFGGLEELRKNECIRLLYEYNNNMGERADIRFLSGAVLDLKFGKPMDKAIIKGIESIANRPYSDYFEAYRRSRQQQGAEEQGE